MLIPSIEQIELDNRVVFIRSDLNVPLEEGQITNDARILASLPTIQHCIEQKAKVILCSHFGRPKASVFNPSLSLRVVAERLSSHLGTEIQLIPSIETVPPLKRGQAVMLENIRFEPGETKNDPHLAKRLARNVDVYCLDAFGTAHRAHASTYGIASFVNEACAGFLLSQEVQALAKVMADPAKPLITVIGGAKVSDKLEVLHNLSEIADTIIVGGGMANTFLLAAGYEIGLSLAEPNMIQDAKQIMSKVDVPLPVDVMVTDRIAFDSDSILSWVENVSKNQIIADVGPETARRYADILSQAKTILWNGPMGVFEITQFGEGTRVVGEAIAEAKGYSVAGGGDTLAAIEKYRLTDQIDYISTGGGAFLSTIEGNHLPGIAALEKHASGLKRDR